MYIKFVKKPVGVKVRENYKLTTDSDKAFPVGKRSRSVNGTIDGKPVEFRITSSATYAVKSDAGANGWIRFDGKTRWFLFDAKTDPFSIDLDFVSGEGNETKNPVRAPKRGIEAEAERRAKFSDTYAERYGNVDRRYSGKTSEASADLLARAFAAIASGIPIGSEESTENATEESND